MAQNQVKKSSKTQLENLSKEQVRAQQHCIYVDQECYFSIDTEVSNSPLYVLTQKLISFDKDYDNDEDNSI